jgi:DNA-binding transcriptional regulator LsrR (DeoR family)
MGLDIYHFLYQNPNSTTKEIGSHLGVSFSVAKTRLAECLSEGKVQVRGAGSRVRVWELSPELFAAYEAKYRRLYARRDPFGETAT